MNGSRHPIGGIIGQLVKGVVIQHVLVIGLACQCGQMILPVVIAPFGRFEAGSLYQFSFKLAGHVGVLLQLNSRSCRAVLKSKVLSRPRIRLSFIFRVCGDCLSAFRPLASAATSSKASLSSCGASSSSALMYPELVVSLTRSYSSETSCGART